MPNRPALPASLPLVLSHGVANPNTWRSRTELPSVAYPKVFGSKHDPNFGRVHVVGVLDYLCYALQSIAGYEVGTFSGRLQRLRNSSRKSLEAFAQPPDCSPRFKKGPGLENRRHVLISPVKQLVCGLFREYYRIGDNGQSFSLLHSLC